MNGGTVGNAAINEGQIEKRAQHPIAQCLIRRLTVPTIYFEARWPTEDASVDLLAIDRAGSGDVHVVDIKGSAASALEAAPALLRIPAHYRWVAFPQDSLDSATQAKISAREGLFPPEGAGRIGLIEIVRGPGDDLGANIVLTAERFRGFYREKAKAFAETHAADIDFGD